MDVTIHIPPDIEESVIAQARAEGLSVEEFLGGLVRGNTTPPAATPSPSDLTYDEWMAKFQELLDSVAQNTVVLPDEAMERESIYGDHGRSNVALTLVDTNILLRLIQSQNPQHALAAAALSKLRRRNAVLCIAPQNLVELWVVATRPAFLNGLGVNPLIVAAYGQIFKIIFRLWEGRTSVVDAWERLVDQHRISGKIAHDAHSVAVMQVYGVTDILTFNVVDFRRFPGIHILDPRSF